MAKLVKRAVSLMLILFLLAGSSMAENTANDPSVITMAPFPYLTDLDKFKEIAAKMWADIEPGTELVFMDWDCYEPDLPTADVFMYDALFTDWLLKNGVMQPISIDDVNAPDDIIPFVLEGIQEDGALYGIPNLACAYYLIYYQDDEAVAAAENLFDLSNVISDRTANVMKPADRSEVLLFDWIDVPYFYVEGLVDVMSDPAAAQDLSTDVNPDALASIAYLRDMSGMEYLLPAASEDQEVDSVSWFNDGFGRARLDVSEALVNLDDIIDQLDIKPFSFSPQENVPLYFADVVSINSSVTNAQKVEKCKKLLNMLASEEFIEALLLNGGNDPQFMLPARQSVWQKMRGLHPLYEKLYGYILQENNAVSRYGSMVHDYLAVAYGLLPALLENQY